MHNQTHLKTIVESLQNKDKVWKTLFEKNTLRMIYKYLDFNLINQYLENNEIEKAKDVLMIPLLHYFKNFYSLRNKRFSDWTLKPHAIILNKTEFEITHWFEHSDPTGIEEWYSKVLELFFVVNEDWTINEHIKFFMIYMTEILWLDVFGDGKLISSFKDMSTLFHIQKHLDKLILDFYSDNRDLNKNPYTPYEQYYMDFILNNKEYFLERKQLNLGNMDETTYLIKSWYLHKWNYEKYERYLKDHSFNVMDLIWDFLWEAEDMNILTNTVNLLNNLIPKNNQKINNKLLKLSVFQYELQWRDILFNLIAKMYENFFDFTRNKCLNNNRSFHYKETEKNRLRNKQYFKNILYSIYDNQPIVVESIGLQKIQ